MDSNVFSTLNPNNEVNLFFPTHSQAHDPFGMKLTDNWNSRKNADFIPIRDEQNFYRETTGIPGIIS